MIVGSKPLARSEITTVVRDYIRSHNLQDRTVRRRIDVDEPLKRVIGRDQISLFELTKLNNQHVKASA